MKNPDQNLPMTASSAFHISVPVSDLTRARAFYGVLLGCTEGRSAEDRIDFNFFGHHLVTHCEPTEAQHRTRIVISSGLKTPVRHFGVIVSNDLWESLAQRLSDAGVEFAVPPQLVFAGEVREQSIFLANDGCGNWVEFKAQARERVFARAENA